MWDFCMLTQEITAKNKLVKHTGLYFSMSVFVCVGNIEKMKYNPTGQDQTKPL